MKWIIETLVAKGFAYVAQGHVLFSPAAMDAANGVLPRYGKLANRSLDEMIAGARVDVAPPMRRPRPLCKPARTRHRPAHRRAAGLMPPCRTGIRIFP